MELDLLSLSVGHWTLNRITLFAAQMTVGNRSLFLETQVRPRKRKAFMIASRQKLEFSGEPRLLPHLSQLYANKRAPAAISNKKKKSEENMMDCLSPQLSTNLQANLRVQV